MKNIIFLLVSIVCFSCSKDPAVVPDYMDPQRFPIEIQPILKTFLKEGNKRGIYCDINKIKKIILTDSTIKLVNNSPCSGYYSESENIIYIDTTSKAYDYTPETREYLIFHELGHGLLKRAHKDFLLNNTEPESIMNSYLIAYYNGTVNFKRQYWVNELFHQETPAPYWAN